MPSNTFRPPIYDFAYYTGAQLKAAVEEERENIRAFLMKKHEEAKANHNYYGCLAVELFGEPHV